MRASYPLPCSACARVVAWADADTLIRFRSKLPLAQRLATSPFTTPEFLAHIARWISLLCPDCEANAK
jgi:hypothetical protein